jgi:hypothetical protein
LGRSKLQEHCGERNVFLPNAEARRHLAHNPSYACLAHEARRRCLYCKWNGRNTCTDRFLRTRATELFGRDYAESWHVENVWLCHS